MGGNDKLIEQVLLNVARYMPDEALQELLDLHIKIELGEPDPGEVDGELTTWEMLYEAKLAEIIVLVR